MFSLKIHFFPPDNVPFIFSSSFTSFVFFPDILFNRKDSVKAPCQGAVNVYISCFHKKPPFFFRHTVSFTASTLYPPPGIILSIFYITGASVMESGKELSAKWEFILKYKKASLRDACKFAQRTCEHMRLATQFPVRIE